MARVPLELVLVNKVSAPLKKANADANKFANTIKGTGGKLRNAAKGTTALGKASAASAGGVRTLGAAMKAAFLPLAALSTAVGALTAGFGILKEQDFAEAKFRTLGGDSVELKKNLQALSHELGGQADILELTKGAYDVASAGFVDAADAAKILKAASLGATGGFTDITTAGGAAVKVLNAYGKTADDAGFLMDQFAQTQADGIITIGAYSQNIGKVATTAAGLKVPLSEVNAIIAQSTAAGVQTETAFTGLNAALAKISSGQAGKKLGIEMNEATLAADGLGGTLEKLQQFSTGELQQAFGIEAFKGIQTAVNDTAKFNQLLENQKNAQGAAAEAAFIASDTIQGQMKRLQTAFTNLFAGQSAFGTALKNTLKVAAVTVEGLAAAFNVVFGIIQALGSIAISVGTAIAKAFGIEATGGAYKLEQQWRKVLKGFEYTGAFIAAAGESIGKVLSWAIGQIVSFRNGVFEIFGNIKTGIENTFKLAFNNAVANLKKAWEKIPAPIRKWITGGIKAVGSWGGANVAELQRAGGELQAALAPGMSNLQGMFTPLQLQVAQEIKEIQAKIAIETNKQQDGAEKIKNTLNQVKDPILTEMDTKVTQIGEGFKSISNTIGQEMKTGIKGLIKGTQTLSGMLSNVANKMADMFLDMAINTAFKSFGFPGFANGGRPPVGRPSIVGEKGPELFVPNASGTIIPNNRLGGGSTNITINVDASGSSEEGDLEEGRQLGRVIQLAVQTEITKQKRPGGLLA